MKMADRVCVVTGANSGLGRVMAGALAAEGATTVLVCRNVERGEAALRAVRAEAASPTPEERVRLEIADLSLLGEVRRLAGALRRRFPRIDVLMNNAGVYLPRRQVTVEGLEAMLAINHLAPFLLTHLLQPSLAAAGAARVITTSSGGHRLGRVNLADLQAATGFDGLRQYCNTKLMNILFTRELARRVKPMGITANCFHPGSVATGFARDEPGWFGTVVRLGAVFLRTPERGARTGIHLATAPEVAEISGEYFVDERPRRPSRRARDDEAAARLWEASARLCAIRDG